MRATFLSLLALPLFATSVAQPRATNAVPQPLPELPRPSASRTVGFTFYESGSPISSKSITSAGTYTFGGCTTGVTDHYFVTLSIGGNVIANTQTPFADNCLFANVYVGSSTTFNVDAKIYNVLGGLIASASLPVSASISAPYGVSISPPYAVMDYETNTWTASITAGSSVGPYTYSWSGVLSGSGSSVTGSISSSGNLNLTITDSHGLQTSTSQWICVNNNC